MLRTALVLIALLLTAARAEAALIVALDINGAPAACATDNNTPCAYGVQLLDVNPAIGVLSYGDTPVLLGGLLVTDSTQMATFGPSANVLNTSSTQLTNTTGAPITATLAVSATGFVPPSAQAFAAGSATWENAIGSALTMSWFNDPSNAQGAETASDTPGQMVATFSDLITLAADASAFNAGPVAVADLAPFSMTLYTQLTLAPGGVVVGRSQTELKPVLVEQVPIPEPALTGVAGLAWLIGRRALRGRRW